MIFADFGSSFASHTLILLGMIWLVLHLLKKEVEKHPVFRDEFKKQATGKAIDLIRRIFKK